MNGDREGRSADTKHGGEKKRGDEGSELMNKEKSWLTTRRGWLRVL